MKKKLVSSLLCAGMAVTAIAGTGLSVQADDDIHLQCWFLQ